MTKGTKSIVMLLYIREKDNNKNLVLENMKVTDTMNEHNCFYVKFSYDGPPASNCILETFTAFIKLFIAPV